MQSRVLAHAIDPNQSKVGSSSRAKVRQPTLDKVFAGRQQTDSLRRTRQSRCNYRRFAPRVAAPQRHTPGSSRTPPLIQSMLYDHFEHCANLHWVRAFIYYNRRHFIRKFRHVRIRRSQPDFPYNISYRITFIRKYLYHLNCRRYIKLTHCALAYG